MDVKIEQKNLANSEATVVPPCHYIGLDSLLKNKTDRRPRKIEPFSQEMHL